MPFTAETREQILQRMVNRVVARTVLNDLTQTSGIFEMLAAVARAVERFQQGQIDMLDDTDLDKAVGDDLVEIGKLYNLTKEGEITATGTVVFSRTGTVGAVTIAIGEQVKVPAATAGQDLIYTTTAVGTILNGNQDSAPVAIVAALPGVDYNVNPDAITEFVTKPSGVDSVTNTVAVTNGRDVETDDNFRKRIKNKIESLSRSTILGLEGAADGANDSVSGKTVQWVGVFEDEFWQLVTPNEPQVSVYIDDGNGTAESTTAVVGGAVTVASGGEMDIYLPNKPVKFTAAYALYINAILVPTSSYYFNPQASHFKLTTAAYPNGLTVGDVVTADYTYYTGLIQLVQKIIDGDPADRTNYPGYRAAGVRVAVLAPSIQNQIVTANITVLQGFDQSTVITAVEAIIQTYINNLGIGEDVIRSELIEQIMSVNGVYNVQLTLPTADVVIGDKQISRTSTSFVTVT